MNKRKSLQPTRANEAVDRFFGYAVLLIATGVMALLVDAALKVNGY